MIYLGQPYSHPDEYIRENRYQVALQVCSRLARTGFVVYSPIVHWHAVALKTDLPTEAPFWWAQNRHMLDRADILGVLCLDGWRESRGLFQEIGYAEAQGLPINFILRLSDAADIFKPGPDPRSPRRPRAGR